MPPPELEVLDYTPTTIGFLVAAPPSTNFSGNFSFPDLNYGRDDIVGFDPRHMIRWYPEGVPAGSDSALLLHGAASPGFHVYDVKCIGPERAAQIQACLATTNWKPGGPLADFRAAYAKCGSTSPDGPWLQLAPDDLNTQLTVELFEDGAMYKPDPADCL